MDKFVLIGIGQKDSVNSSVVRVTPSCFDKLHSLKCSTGISMCKILEQCVDFALEHMEVYE